MNDACAFLGPGMGRMDDLEVKVHGRGRKLNDMAWSDAPANDGDSTGLADEGRFGVLHRPVMLAKGIEKDAQWTGVVTGIAVSMLESNMVDAVVCIAGGDDWSEPEPILARSVGDVLRGRGVKPALAPSLRVLDEIKADKSIRRLFCFAVLDAQYRHSGRSKMNLDLTRPTFLVPIVPTTVQHRKLREIS